MPGYAHRPFTQNRRENKYPVPLGRTINLIINDDGVTVQIFLDLLYFNLL